MDIKYTCELILILYYSVEQELTQKIILGTCYIPETSPLSVYETHANTINWLFSRFGDKTDIITTGDIIFVARPFHVTILV